MGRLLYKLLDVFSNNFVRQFLTSLGVGLATGVPLYLLISSIVDNVADHYGSSPYIGLLAVFGIDDALGILFTAILTRAYWQSMKPRWVTKQ